MRKRGACLTLCAVVSVACTRPPADDTALILSQSSLGTTLEVTVDAAQLDVVVIRRSIVLERTKIKISPENSDKVRDLFWDALLHQPTDRLNPVRDLVFEQEWRGTARVQKVRIQGYPLSSKDRRAYDFINSLLPERYRFLVDAGPYRRSAKARVQRGHSKAPATTAMPPIRRCLVALPDDLHAPL